MQTVRWKFFINFEKDEAWLNEMAKKGLALNGYALCRYTFTDCSPGEYTYRIEFLRYYSSHPESQQYLSFLAENGVEHVASWARWGYFRKRTEGGQFDIYSDVTSRIEHYQRVNVLWLFIMCSFFIQAICHTYIGIESLLSELERTSTMSLVYAPIFLLLGVALFFAWNSIRKKIKGLRLERQLRE